MSDSPQLNTWITRGERDLPKQDNIRQCEQNIGETRSVGLSTPCPHLVPYSSQLPNMQIHTIILADTGFVQCQFSVEFQCR